MAETINNIEQNDKLVRVSFIKGILEKLYNWLPFRKNNDGSIVQVDKDGNTTNITTKIAPNNTAKACICSFFLLFFLRIVQSHK